MNPKVYKETVINCYHCGEPCESSTIHIEEKPFCCQGCKMVYELINKVDMCEYYQLNKNPGPSQKKNSREHKFAFLDDETVASKLILFKDQKQSRVIFYLPQMHCSSCIWLLENMNRLNKNIIQSQVDFLKKEINIVFNQEISLREVAELLTGIGYEPHISLNDLSEKKIRTYDKKRLYKIGIAGFCFGNIMMLSFPEYLSLGNIEEKGLKELFSYLNIALSLPVFFYCASGFFGSAWTSIQQKFLNIDTPIALAIVITFCRSIYEIVSGTGAGYLDSMSGIVFFMLIGRFFQDKTYNTLTFNRDYTSYFPLGVSVVEEDGSEKQIPVSKLKTGQRIKVRSQEIIPADAILFLGHGNIDYSFVTGESFPVEKSIGEIVYAGGKQTGGAIELEVIKEVSQSYLTQLWNSDIFKKGAPEKEKSFIHLVSRYFTLALFLVAFSSAAFWYINDPAKILNSVTSILIVACPCALLLSATFTNGNMLKELQRVGFYAKNANVLEKISKAKIVVFDKTGTVTLQQKANVVYEGIRLDLKTRQLVRSLAVQSSHPLSKAIVASLPFSKSIPVKNFAEIKGMGINGIVDGNKILLGSAEFVLGRKSPGAAGSCVFLCLNNEIIGNYRIRNKYRMGLAEMIHNLKKKYTVALISGDNNSEQEYIRSIFGEDAHLLFDHKPEDKLTYIKQLQTDKTKVIMVGDGLNDAGALKQSDIGIAVTDDTNNFSPACDVILNGKSFAMLDQLLNYSSKGKQIILCSFVLSVLYNVVGLYYAFFGELKPVIAAILMPLSSISIILFTTGTSSILSIKYFHHLKKEKN